MAIDCYEKGGCHFVNMCHEEKCQITEPPSTVWVSGFPSVEIIGATNLEFCHMMNFYKIVAIFAFLDNG